MTEFLSAMMGTFIAIATIAIVVCVIIIFRLLTKLNNTQRDIEKLRRENGELWSAVHDPFIKKMQGEHIEDGM